MKKIAHFIDSEDPGGAETLVIESCKYLKANKYDPEIYHFGNKWLEEKCELYKIPSVLVPNYKLYKSKITLPFFLVGFYWFLKKRKVDILHSHLTDSIISAALPAYFNRLTHIGTLHDVYTLESNKARLYALKIVTKYGVKLVAVSYQIQKYLVSECAFKNNTIKVIHNGVNISNKLKKNSAIELRNALGVKEKEILLIYVGRLVEIKAHDVILASMRILKKENQAVKLLLVGDGPEKEKCEKLAIKYGIKDEIIILGHRDDVFKLLEISDCFVMSSRSEGLSCSIIEAMAIGLPVIATNVGGNNELVQDGRNGYLVPVDDSIALAKKIKNLIKDYDKRLRFGKNSFDIVRAEYSIEKMMRNYIEMYEK